MYRDGDHPNIITFARILFVLDPTFRSIVIKGYVNGQLIQTVKDVRDHYTPMSRTFFQDAYGISFGLLEAKVCVEYLWTQIPRFDNYDKEKVAYLESNIQAEFDAFTGPRYSNDEDYTYTEPPF